MRFVAALALVATTALAAACSGIFRQYEYEEDIYLSLDGSATVYVNSSIAALDALRGAVFDASPAAPLDRDGLRAYFSGPGARVHGRIGTSRRSGRRFVHIRVDVDDIRRLNELPPFAWSRYQFDHDGRLLVYRQTVGPSAAKTVANAAWSGRELTAFRLHVPSNIVDTSALPQNHKRGNILVWEQPLADRLRGVPVDVEAKMETESILYRTVWLFGATFVAVAAAFAAVLLWVLRRGRRDDENDEVVSRHAAI